MKTRKIRILFPCMFIFFFLLVPFSAFCEKTADEKKEVIAAPIEIENTTLTTLSSIYEAQQNLLEQITQKKKKLKQTQIAEEKKILNEEIDHLFKSYQELEHDFVKSAAGIDPNDFQRKTKKEFDWQEELRDLVWPIIKEMKSITEQPRKVEKLRRNIELYETNIPLMRKGIINIRKLIEDTEEKSLKTKLEEIRTEWVGKREQAESQLAVASNQLDEITKKRKPFLEMLSDSMYMFFRKRGLNILFALSASIIAFLFIRLSHRLLMRFSPLYKSEPPHAYTRLIDVFFTILSVVLALGAGIFILYLSGDWVLLSLSIIVLLWLIWTAKEKLPGYIEQIRILLNLGPIREKERVIYNGIPWIVSRLNFYTILENPNFPETQIRVPLKNLLRMESRPIREKEPWFPCRDNDWVILSDGTFGQAVGISPELVELALRGGAKRTYKTSDFLGKSPKNLSKGYRLKVVIGLDYQHQADATREIPETLKEYLTEHIKKEGYSDILINLKVEFKEPGASSLDLVTIVDFRGTGAHFHNRLKRLLNRLTVEACTMNGWSIPFQTFTVHTSET